MITGDWEIIRGAVDDALSMNTGDVAASGFVDWLVVGDIININAFNVPKDKILEQIAFSFCRADGAVQAIWIPDDLFRRRDG